MSGADAGLWVFWVAGGAARLVMKTTHRIMVVVEAIPVVEVILPDQAKQDFGLFLVTASMIMRAMWRKASV
jgi:hypothetical protein